MYSHSVVKLHDAAEMFLIVDDIRGMTLKSCNCGKYGLFWVFTLLVKCFTLNYHTVDWLCHLIQSCFYHVTFSCHLTKSFALTSHTVDCITLSLTADFVTFSFHICDCFTLNCHSVDCGTLSYHTSDYGTLSCHIADSVTLCCHTVVIVTLATLLIVSPLVVTLLSLSPQAIKLLNVSP